MGDNILHLKLGTFCWIPLNTNFASKRNVVIKLLHSLVWINAKKNYLWLPISSPASGWVVQGSHSYIYLMHLKSGEWGIKSAQILHDMKTTLDPFNIQLNIFSEQLAWRQLIITLYNFLTRHIFLQNNCSHNMSILLREICSYENSLE